MMIARIEGATRVCGQEQGYIGLPIRDVVSEDGVPMMMTAWTPTPEEIERIKQGANIILIVCGTIPPPCNMTVGKIPA